MIGAVDKESTLPWLGEQGWFAFMVDLFAVMVLLGVIGAVVIRKVQRPARFEGSHLGEADLILALIAGIVTTLLLWHASRISLGLNEWPEGPPRSRTRCQACSATVGPRRCSNASSCGPTS